MGKRKFALKAVLSVRRSSLFYDPHQADLNDEEWREIRDWCDKIIEADVELFVGLYRQFADENRSSEVHNLLADWVEERGGHRIWSRYICYRMVINARGVRWQ